MREDIIIVGAGLAGLTSAYELQKRGLKPLILEAESRMGGRIFTKEVEGQLFELGATWVFQDVRLKRLINDLELALYPQYLQGDALIKYDPSMAIQRSPTAALMGGATYHKVKGGTGTIIQALAAKIPSERILLEHRVNKIDTSNHQISLTTTNGSVFQAAKVLLTLPPKVIADQIKFTDDHGLKEIMNNTHTWMADSSKFSLFMDKDYWRQRKLSGFVFSNYDLIREMQDHSSDTSYGFVGFMQPNRLVKEQRRREAANELASLFGTSEENIVGYEDFLWGEYFKDQNNVNYNAGLLPHQNNGHAIYLQPHFDGRLFFAGAETSPSNPGYMEGAVESALRAVDMITTS